MELLSVAQITGYMEKLPDWGLEDNGRSIVKIFEFKDFDWAIIFVNEVADLMEKNPHHPDIMLYEQNKVEIRLTTRSAGGLTEKDFEMAAEIDKLIGKVEGEAEKNSQPKSAPNKV